MGNQLWHTDSIFLPVPALANVLAARVLSSTGGETQLCSTRAAWRDLPAELRARVDGAVFRHRLAHSRRELSPVLDERATLHRGRPWPYDEERTLASICVSVTAADGVDSVRVGDAG